MFLKTIDYSMIAAGRKDGRKYAGHARSRTFWSGFFEKQRRNVIFNKRQRKL